MVTRNVKYTEHGPYLRPHLHGYGQEQREGNGYTRLYGGWWCKGQSLIFKMGSDTYDTDTIKFNFKSKKALINNVYTEQEDGFLTGMKSKRDSSGVIYLQHGRYTTCDDPHPDFYISLSRAKVRPGKDVSLWTSLSRGV